MTPSSFLFVTAEIFPQNATISDSQAAHRRLLFVTKGLIQMSEQNGQNGAKPQETQDGITKITVGGYKSIAQEQSIEIRPLTILAGANSSGKSSIMQPLLLLKQTLEASYDPGALLLDGPIVNFTLAEQILSIIPTPLFSNNFLVAIATSSDNEIATAFVKDPGTAFRIQAMYSRNKGRSLKLAPEMEHGQILNELTQLASNPLSANVQLSIVRNRCFLEFGLKIIDSLERAVYPASLLSNIVEIARVFGSPQPSISDIVFTTEIKKCLQELIYLPGLRGRPSRTYLVAAISSNIQGLFESYMASILVEWQLEHQEKINDLHADLAELGLTSNIVAKTLNDAQVEISVGRTLSSDESDMVNIADVGIGVSQTLPVLVALLAAKPGQLVYLEQPEIHLHPRAQTAMAQVLADAAMRGVRVVAETHSSLLLLGVQTLVAEGRLPPELVKLHWFKRGEDGATTIQSADLDEGGRFGDWPEDFDTVELKAQSRYLDAAEARLMRK